MSYTKSIKLKAQKVAIITEAKYSQKLHTVLQISQNTNKQLNACLIVYKNM